MKDNSFNPENNPEETEELVAIARKFGFDKVASKLLGEDVEDDTEDEFSEESGKLPSQHSFKAVNDTLKGMGIEWGD